MKYDLEERMAAFGEAAIRCAKTLPGDMISDDMIRQFVRAATSIGANYAEANGASSRRDFRHKIFICKKEAQETKHWIRMLASAFLAHRPALKKLWGEAHELMLILQKICSSLKNPPV